MVPTGQALRHVVSFHFQEPCEATGIIMSILKMGRLICRGIKPWDTGFKISNYWDFHPGCTRKSVQSEEGRTKLQIIAKTL